MMYTGLHGYGKMGQPNHDGMLAKALPKHMLKGVYEKRNQTLPVGPSATARAWMDPPI